MYAILMPWISGAPIVARACAAERAWHLIRWNEFMVPKPFPRLVLAIVARCDIPSDTPLDQFEPKRQLVQETVMSLMRESERMLKEPPR